MQVLNKYLNDEQAIVIQSDKNKESSVTVVDTSDGIVISGVDTGIKVVGEVYATLQDGSSSIEITDNELDDVTVVELQNMIDNGKPFALKVHLTTQGSNDPGTFVGFTNGAGHTGSKYFLPLVVITGNEYVQAISLELTAL